MKLMEIIVNVRYFVKTGAEAKVILHKNYHKEFVCKIIELNRDPEKKEGYIITFEKSKNTNGFPTEDRVFKSSISDIKKIDTYLS